jgi:Ca2+-binding EF-hand superfamily protein
MQKEFVRLDKDKSGTLNKWELEKMTHSKLIKSYDLDWDEIICACDYN